MPLFGPKFEPGTEGNSISNSRGVTGLTVQPPEVPGSMARRSRMFGEAIRIAESGGDVATIVSQLLAREHSFVKWVSLRGGLAFVAMVLEDPARSLSDLTNFAGRPIPEGGEELLQRYSQLEDASFSDVLGDPRLTRDQAWHLDIVAWSAAAFVGGGLHRSVLQADIPAAQILSDPGWYAEPVFSKCERYWDGADWTARCRVLDGKLWRSTESPF